MRLLVAFTAFFLFANICLAQTYPPAVPGDFVVKDFKFQSGETLPELKLHYVTLGTPKKDKDGHTTNAVLVLHGTGGTHAQFLRESFAGTLFGKGQMLDAERYFIIIPDNVGHGASSKPSDGLHAKFPHYNYHDMVTLQQRLLTEKLGVDHLRLVMGTSMGGMHSWCGLRCIPILWTPRCRWRACRWKFPGAIVISAG